MTTFTTTDSKKIKETLIQFQEQYKEAFEYDVGYLTAHITNDQLGLPLQSTVLMQIYEMAGLIKPSCSIYRQMYKIICKNFNIRRDIIEVGSGRFPILGDYISRKQLKLGKGTVTVYDSKLWTSYPTKAKLEKCYFNDRISISKDSLLVGMFPCDATEYMVDRVIAEDLECCIALCGCNHSDIPFLPTSKYHEMLIDRIAQYISEEKQLQIGQFSKKCFENGYKGYPILLVKNKPKIKLFTYIQNEMTKTK